jgi:Na+/phosphate symporter
MTTIGPVSAGLLTFPWGLGLVFRENVGTTGTGWLVTLVRAANDLRRGIGQPAWAWTLARHAWRSAAHRVGRGE